MDKPEAVFGRAPVQRGIRLHGGELCYLCDQPIREGDAAVFYYDETFWHEPLLYHGDCWDGADLAAKEIGADSVERGAALMIGEAVCAGCSEAIEVGEPIVRVRGGAAAAATLPGHDRQSAMPRVYHLGCYPGDAE